MNIYLIVILTILIGEYLLDIVVEFLNVRAASPDLDEEFSGFYDAEKYKKSQNYLKDNTKFSMVKDTFFTGVVVLFILIGGFNFIDRIARGFNFGLIPTGLVFGGIILIGYEILEIPFAAYRTFVIEGKYGFNKTTPKTFASDLIKSLFLTALIGGGIFALIIWFFNAAGIWAWVYCWLGVGALELLLTFLAPVVIMPLFNKFIPLEEGELKKAIEEYAKKESFKLQGIFKMDASRRSSKSNAFFTGFGRWRRIALFDTLIEKHTTDELVSVLSHEIGHYKKKHVLKHIIFSIITTGVMFFIVSFFINNEGLFSAFKMENMSIYASFVFFGFLYTPISFVFSVLMNIFSRRHEYEADLFASKTYKRPEAFITALKKLSVDNLSNLTPHPVKVFLDYSHPPVLERIKALREYIKLEEHKK